MSKKENKRKLQPTLGYFNYTLHTNHRGEKVPIALPKFVETVEGNIQCPDCPKRFENTQGLSVHLKCTHQNIPNNNGNLLFRPKSKKSAKNNLENDVKATLDSVLDKVESRIAKSEAAKKNASKKRKSYTALFKAEVINKMDEGISQDEVAEHFRISQSQVCRWLSKRKSIMHDASLNHRKLLRKGKRPKKYVELYKLLWLKFKDARSKGHRVNFHWLWSKARILHKETNGGDDSSIKQHVIVRFLAEYKIRMRRRQRNKRISKKQKEGDLKKWHATFRERCVCSGKDETYHQKWGRFKPSERINVDQSPLPFVIDVKRTYEFVEPGSKNHNTWISQPGSGLDKRQCTLQVAFRPEGKQPRLAIIFRGKGKRISEDEKLAWHPGVDIYFQPNAWMDTKVCCEWGEKTLTEFIKSEKVSRHVLLLDNLEAHTKEEFKSIVNELSGVVWFGLPNATDLWQPVDAGYAQVLKSLIGIEHRDWLDDEDNADRWFCNSTPFSAKERRILISHWAGNAWEKLCEPKYDRLRMKCWVNTGCLITADGSDDNKIKPEGLPDYVVPPPSILDASPQPADNAIVPEEVHHEEDEPHQDIDEIDLIENEPDSNNNTERVVIQTEDRINNETDSFVERNVFDIFDSFVLN